MTYKDTFQDRISNAATARAKALERLRTKPPPDPKVVAERVERQAQRAARDAEKTRAKKAARETAAAAKAATSPPPTEEELKAARDARYAKRKARR